MYIKEVLPNGLRLVSFEVPGSYSTSLSLFIGAGSRYERKGGVFHFLEHLCFKGTGRYRSSFELSRAIEGIGGILNGATDKEYTVFWAKVPYIHVDRALSVLSSLVMEPVLSPEDMERERGVIVEEIKLSLDSPSHRVDILLDEILWGGHPLGRDVAGDEESVKSITREDILEHFSLFYRPQNSVLSIAGNFDGIRERAWEYFSSWEGGLGDFGDEGVPPLSGPAVKGERKDTELVHISLGFRALSSKDPERFSIDLFNIFLGEGMCSRLFTELREKRGLVYEISSLVEHFRDTGSLIINLSVEPRNVEEALKVLFYELGRIREGDVCDDELERAKEYGKGRLLLRMEDTRAISSWGGGQELLVGYIKEVPEVLDIVERITWDDIKRVIDRVIRKENLCLAYVGPVSGLEKFVENF